MAKIKEGMTENEVLALLGKPEDMQAQTDLGGISTTRTREIWRYGTAGHLTFPTLGCVYIDKDRKVQYVDWERGEPPDPKILPEEQLRSLLRLIDKAPSYNSAYHCNPLRVIQIVNALQPLGKEKALAAIEEYLRVASKLEDNGREGVFLVLRVLFDIPTDPGYMPRMYVGAPYPSEPKDAKQIPRFPILLQDDVPLLLVSGYMLAGIPQQPESHVKYFREKGQLRSKLLSPGDAPLGLFDALEKNKSIRYEKHDAQSGILIANQLLNLIESVYRRDADRDGLKFSPYYDEVDCLWKSIEADVAKLHIRWNHEKARYTLKDGSHLREPTQTHDGRHIWKPDGLNGEAELIIERKNSSYVWVSLEWSGKKDNQMPPVDLSVLAVRDKAKTLTKLNESAVSGTGGDEAFSSRTFVVKLAQGSELQARVLIGKSEQLSPVYNP